MPEQSCERPSSGHLLNAISVIGSRSQCDDSPTLSVEVAHRWDLAVCAFSDRGEESGARGRVFSNEACGDVRLWSWLLLRKLATGLHGLQIAAQIETACVFCVRPNRILIHALLSVALRLVPYCRRPRPVVFVLLSATLPQSTVPRAPFIPPPPCVL